GDDRAYGKGELDVAAVAGGLAADQLDALAGLRERLAPQGVDVGPAGADPDGVLGLAAEEDRHRPVRLDGAERALEPVELALVVEGLVGGEGAPQHVDELGGAPVAGRLVLEVAVALLVDVAAAGDVVDRDPAGAGEVVERRELARGQGGLDEPGPLGDEHAQPLGV